MIVIIIIILIFAFAWEDIKVYDASNGQQGGKWVVIAIGVVIFFIIAYIIGNS